MRRKLQANSNSVVERSSLDGNQPLAGGPYLSQVNPGIHAPAETSPSGLFFAHEVDEIGTPGGGDATDLHLELYGLLQDHRAIGAALTWEEAHRGRPLCHAELITARRTFMNGYRVRWR